MQPTRIALAVIFVAVSALPTQAQLRHVEMKTLGMD
jgi:hypothetical protein